MGRRVSRLLATSSAAFALMGAVSLTNANAAPNATELLGLSADGTSAISRNLHGLFEGIVLVPGDVQQDSFTVHNIGLSDGYLTVLAKESIDGDDALREALRLGAGVDQTPQNVFPAPPANKCVVLEVGSHQNTFAPGDSSTINTELSLAEALTGTAGQASNVSLEVLVFLSDLPYDSHPGDVVPCPAVTGPPTEPGENGGNGVTTGTGQVPEAATGLAFTGAQMPWLFAILAAGSLGWLLLLARRRGSNDQTTGNQTTDGQTTGNQTTGN